MQKVKEIKTKNFQLLKILVDQKNFKQTPNKTMGNSIHTFITILGDQTPHKTKMCITKYRFNQVREN